MVWICWTSTAESDSSLSLPTICSTGPKLKNGSSNTSFEPTEQAPSGVDSTIIGSYGTNSQPKTGGTLPRSFPTICKAKVFKNPKIVGEIDRGKESNPIPLAGAVAADDGEGSTGGDTTRDLLFFRN